MQVNQEDLVQLKGQPELVRPVEVPGHAAAARRGRRLEEYRAGCRSCPRPASPRALRSWRKDRQRSMASAPAGKSVVRPASKLRRASVMASGFSAQDRAPPRQRNGILPRQSKRLAPIAAVATPDGDRRAKGNAPRRNDAGARPRPRPAGSRRRAAGPGPSSAGQRPARPGRPPA